MNWKCFFGHRFVEIGRSLMIIYCDEQSKIPYDIKTLFLYECSNCFEKKLKKLEGNWVKKGYNDNNDDDEDKEPEPRPLIPDDYYDFIEKK